MGEPQYNWKNILQVMKDMKTYREGFTFLPCYNTILPKVKVFGKSPVDVLKEEVMSVKEYLDGFMHIQISTNKIQSDESIIIWHIIKFSLHLFDCYNICTTK